MKDNPIFLSDFLIGCLQMKGKKEFSLIEASAKRNWILYI
jgi:hypothetical protein